MKIPYVIPISLCLIASPAMAVDTCESIIENYRLANPPQVTPSQVLESAEGQQALVLLKQGYEECQSGQKEQSVTTLTQAISILTAQKK